METKRDRVDRLKNKFRPLGRIARLKEFVRYDRARKGQLAHRFPQEYVDEIWYALSELLREDFTDAHDFNKMLEAARRAPSEPFIKPDEK